MKLKLTELKIQSFITAFDRADQHQVKGGGITGTETIRCPTIPLNACPSVAGIDCKDSIQVCRTV